MRRWEFYLTCVAVDVAIGLLFGFSGIHAWAIGCVNFALWLVQRSLTRAVQGEKL